MHPDPLYAGRAAALVLGRLAAAGAVGDDASGVTWEHGIATTPSLLLTGTYH